MNNLGTLLTAGSSQTATTAADGVSVGVAIVGGIVGIIGLYLSWSSGRAERAAVRLEQMVAIEADARARGPLRTDNLGDVEKHRKFLAHLDEEVRLHQRFAFDTSRRIGSGVSTGAVLGWAIYGAFLLWMAFHFPGTDAAAFAVACVFVAAALACLSRAAVITGRRVRLWQARRDAGIKDLYSRNTVTVIRGRFRRQGGSASTGVPSGNGEPSM